MNALSELSKLRRQINAATRRRDDDEDDEPVSRRRQDADRGLQRKTKRRKANILENRRKQFPRLANPDLQKELARDYLPYARNAFDYYSQIAALTTYLRVHLNDRTILQYSRGNTVNAIVADRKRPDLNYNKVYTETMKAAASFGRYLKIKGNEVQLNLAPVTFSVICLLNSETIPVLQKKFSALFGKPFKIPTRYSRVDGHVTVDVDDYSTELKPLRYFQQLNFGRDEPPGYFQPEKLKTLDVIDNNIAKATTIEVKLFSVSLMDNFTATAGQNSGPLSSNSLISFNFRVLGVVTLPLEFALWATHATDLTEFVPKIFREHFDNLGQMALNLKTRFEDKFARTMHVGKVKELNEQRIKEYEIKVVPRVNKDNFCILISGSIFYVPPVDQSAFYIGKLRESYDAEKGVVKSNMDIKEIHNLPLLADWINDGFAYTDSNGTVQARRLIGAIPLDNITIARDLGLELDQQKPDLLKNIAMFGDKICTAFKLYDTSPTTTNGKNIIASNYYTLFMHIAGRYGTYPYRQIVEDARGKAADIVPEDEKWLINEFVRLSASIAKNFMQSEYAISIKCSYLYYYYLFGVYVNNYAQYSVELVKAQQANTPIPTDKLPNKFEIPNLPGIRAILPHQVSSVAQSLSANPPQMIALDISAGGGKTLQMLIHAIALKKAGLIKTAMIICPGQLIKEWTTQVNAASQGAINIVPINADVIKKIVKDLGFDRRRYLNYLKNMPINTIFVVSLNFLRLTTDYFTGERTGELMQFGEQYIRFFPNVQMLRQLQPDLIMLDESHYTKNVESNRTLAMFSLAPVSKYRGVASGTMIQNTPSDLPAQYGLLNPAILGTVDKFQEEFGIVENGKFVGLKPGMEGELSRRRRPYVFSVNKSRRDWAQLLPDIYIDFIPVDLTDAQQKFYNDILREALDELLSDPGVRELIGNSDEDAQKKLEKLIDKKLHVVELFVNAPDTNPAFVSSKNMPITRDDLVSPKVKIIDALIRKHFEGDKTRQIPPDKNKVIVFSYNKEVSRHIWRHSRYSKIGLHYAVSNPESRIGTDEKLTGDEVLLKFREDPDIKVLYADETSLREGYNLQMASEIIRVQSLLAPGAQEQANSRVMRPDVDDVYGRSRITIDWLATNRTYEVGKAARLIAKMIINHHKKEEDNPQWQAFTKNTKIPNLPLVKLNLDLLSKPEYNTLTVDSAGNLHTSDTLRDYFESYRVLNNWEISEFDNSRHALLINTARRLGVPVSQIKNLREDSKLPLDGKAVLPGSKSAWVPLANGGQPVDNRKLNLKPLAVLIKDDPDDDDEDEESGTLVDQISYGRDSLVWTEYGWGYIRGLTEQHSGVLEKQVRVAITGFNQNRPVTISKQAVFMPTPPSTNRSSKEYIAWHQNYVQLEKDLKRAGSKGITFMQGVGLPSTTQVEVPTPVRVKETTPTKPPQVIKHVQPSENEEPEEKPIKPERLRNIPQHAPKDKTPPKAGRGEPIFIDAMVINGIPAIMAYADEDGFSRLEQYTRWDRVPPFLNAQVRTYQGAVNLVNYIKKEFPDVDIEGAPIQQQLNHFLVLAKRLRGQTSNNLHVRGRAAIPYSMITNFIQIAHTKTKSLKYIKVYPIMYNGELFAAVPIGVQQQQSSRLRGANIPGVEKFRKADEVAVHFCNSVRQAERLLEKLSENERLRNYNNTIAVLNNPTFKGLIGI